MKTYKEETSVRRVVGRTTCDLCGKATEDDDWGDGPDTDEVTVRRTWAVYSYGEYMSGGLTEVDLCPDCFGGKLVPWLRSQGAEVREQKT